MDRSFDQGPCGPLLLYLIFFSREAAKARREALQKQECFWIQVVKDFLRVFAASREPVSGGRFVFQGCDFPYVI
jgi:hypothetical protein